MLVSEIFSLLTSKKLVSETFVHFSETFSLVDKQNACQWYQNQPGGNRFVAGALSI